MIDIGDAVLSVLLDSSQANAQLNQFGSEVPTKLAPVQAAFNGTSSAVQEVTHHMAVGQQGARELGEVMNLAGETSRESMYQARGEMMLVDELLGIKLPRHVVSFIAEIPGVGAALSAAFQATAVLFIIEAIAKGIEKIIEWREEAHKLELAQLNFGSTVGASFIELDEKLLRTGIKADELRGDHLAALAKELQLINLQTLHDLSHEFETLSKAADALFKNLETHWFTFNLGAKGAETALKDFLAQYNFLLEVDRDKTGAANLLAGTKKQAEDVLTLMQRFQGLKDLPTDTWDQINQKSAQEKTILEQLHKLNVDINDTKARTLGIDEKTLKAQEALVATFAAQDNAQKKIAENEAGEEANKKKEEYDKIEAEQEKVLKAQLAAEKKAEDEEDARDEARRNKFIADLQEKEKLEIAATKQGSEERIRVIDAAIKEEQTLGIHQTAEDERHGNEDTAFFKSLQLQKLQAVQARIDQQQKAELKAESDALKTDEQEGKREVDAIKQSSTEQQKAIADLGKAKLVSQADESRRLVASYEDEKNKVLAVLEKLLSDEQALMQKAAARLEQAKLTPGITPEQVQQAETLLGQIKNAVANTEAQIQKTKTDARTKELAADRGYYAVALALAIANGKQQLAAQLQANHALLVQNQIELVSLKSKKDLTKADQDRIAVLQKLTAAQKTYEKELEHDAKAGLTAWKQFSDGLRGEAQKDVISLQEMGEKMRQDLREFAADIGTQFAAMIQGQESFGQAMAHATEQLIGKMAQQWGEFFAAKAIADIFFNPALGAAEFAAAAALFTVGALMSSLGSSTGGEKSAASSPGGTPAPGKNSPGIAAGGQPSQTVNVLHLATGGLVAKPTIAVVGDSGPEAAIPLRDRSALQAIANAITAQMHGGGQELHLHIKTDLPGFVKVLNHGTKSGKWRVHSNTSDRAIKKT